MSLSGFSDSKQQLRDHQIGHVVVNRPDDEHHPLLEQARVDIKGALAACGLLDHHRHEVLRTDQGIGHFWDLGQGSDVQ
jgi:predicted amidohydrolase